VTEPAGNTPQDLPGIDADEFVGGPPAGESDPTAFASNDQSAAPGEDSTHSDRPGEAGAEETLTDAGVEPHAGDATA
jgi:hypothetical protein